MSSTVYLFLNILHGFLLRYLPICCQSDTVEPLVSDRQAKVGSPTGNDRSLKIRLRGGGGGGGEREC